MEKSCANCGSVVCDHNDAMRCASGYSLWKPIPFKREARYHVIKLKTGKPVDCVVVESDWPIYEDVWSMIQCVCEQRPTELEQLRQWVKELEYEESKSADMAHKNLQLWMEVSEKLSVSEKRVAELEALSVTNIMIDVVAGDGSGHEVYAKSVKDVEQLLSRLSEKAEDFDLETLPLRNALAASQLDNLRLRKAYVLLENFAQSVGGSSSFWEDFSEQLEEASVIANFNPTDTEALEAYIKERIESSELAEVSAIQITNLTSRLESLLVKYAALKERKLR